MRTMIVSAKCSDLCIISFGHMNVEHTGYVPEWSQIGSDDYVEFEIELDTGKVVGFVPISDEEIKDHFLVEDGDEDEDEDEDYLGFSTKK